jgi:hypothetical protein
MGAVKATHPKGRGGVGATLRITRLEQLCGQLKPWRTDDDLELLKAAKGSALILPFVKGLMLSAQLIYVMRVELSGTDLEVDWGHLLDAENRSCSPECDIIIHHKGHLGQWNGSDDPIMNFKFVSQDSAVAVISCKSYATDVDKEYVRKLRRYVKNVFLFAECCSPDKVNSLRKKANDAGYAGFGYLYAFDKKTGVSTNDPKAWSRFLDAVTAKVKKARRRN